VSGTGGGGAGAQFANAGSGGSGIVIVKYAAGVPYRELTETVRNGGTGGTVISKTTYRYEDVGGWGEEMVELIVDPDTAALTSTFEYYTSNTDRGDYRKLRSVTRPTGNWTAYDYYDDWDRRGNVKYQQSPYVNAPASAPASVSSTVGRVVYKEYVADWSGRYNRVSLTQESVNNVVTAKTTQTFSDVGSGTTVREKATGNAYWDSTNSIQTIVERYRSDADADRVGQVYFVKNADESQTSYAVSRGSYNHNPSSPVFTISGTGQDWVVYAMKGSTNSTGATTENSFNTLTFENVEMIDKETTLEVAIFNNSGHLFLSEEHVYNSGSFERVSWKSRSYDSASGRLTQEKDSSGAIVDYHYQNGRLAYTIAADGQRVDYEYDELGRVDKETKDGIAAGSGYAVQVDVVTTHTLDALGRTTQSVVSASGISETLTSSTDYDLAGRIEESIVPGNYKTEYAYALGGKKVTTTFPGGGTEVREVYLDGQLKSVSGTAVIQESHGYWIDSGSGRRARQTTLGGNGSAWTNTGWDWLGRQYEEWTPGWNGNAVAKFNYYNSEGQLYKTTAAEVDPTIYEYNTLGRLVAEGLDLNGNDALDPSSSDRIATTSVKYTKRGSDWWLETQQGAYPQTGASAGSHNVTSETRVRLTGLTGGGSETKTYDAHDNETHTNVTVDRDPGDRLVTTTVDVAGASNDVVTIARNGRLVSEKTQSDITTTYAYDQLGRRTTVDDPRIGDTVTDYINNTALVDTVTDPASNEVADYSYDSAGRVSSVANALNKLTYYSYNDRGQKLKEWGAATYPVERVYDGMGRVQKLKTYADSTADFTTSSWPASPGTAQETTWNYHAATNFLSSKVDDAGESVTYTYTQAGMVKTRTWARSPAIVTTYGYDGDTRELLTITYSDSTPDVTYTYDRMGNIATVDDVTGLRTFTYDLANGLELTREALNSTYYGGRRLDWEVDSLGRLDKFGVGSGATDYSITQQDIGYDTSTGRLNEIEGKSITQTTLRTFGYTYTADSDLIASTYNTALGYTDVRTWESDRNLLATRETKWGTTSKALFDYTTQSSPLDTKTGRDALGRVKGVTKTEELFDRYGNGTQGLHTLYEYNDRSELTSEETTLGGSLTTLTGRDDSYVYDLLGNRKTSTHNGLTTTYTTNALNQYTKRELPSGVDGAFDVAGATSSGTVEVNNSSAGITRHGDYFFKSHTMDNTPDAVYDDLDIDDGTTSTTLPAFLRAAPEMKTYDEDGNLLSDGRWVYTYDAENRLIEMYTRGAPGDPIFTSGTQAQQDAATAVWTSGVERQRLTFEYDYLHRRVRKVNHEWTTDWSAVTERRFIYNGWNPIAEYWGAYNADNLVTTHARYSFWGLDITGSLTGAAGIGGLLMMHESAGTYLPVFDQLGNVHAMLHTVNGTVSAAYEYDAYGNSIRSSGSTAADNPYRSATKYTDAETALVYYGRRYYDPKDGRFVGRDPISEQGGINLYAYVTNGPVNSWDYLGMNPPDDGLFFGRLSEEAKEAFIRQLRNERRAHRNLMFLNELKQQTKASMDGGGIGGRGTFGRAFGPSLTDTFLHNKAAAFGSLNLQPVIEIEVTVSAGGSNSDSPVTGENTSDPSGFATSGESSAHGGGTLLTPGVEPDLDAMLTNDNVVNQLGVAYGLNQNHGVVQGPRSTTLSEIFATLDPDQETSNTLYISPGQQYDNSDIHSGNYSASVEISFVPGNAVGVLHTHPFPGEPSDGVDFAWEVPALSSRGLWSVVVSPDRIYFTGPDAGQYYFLPTSDFISAGIANGETVTIPGRPPVGPD
jgi:RHS repeat-associated protein